MLASEQWKEKKQREKRERKWRKEEPVRWWKAEDWTEISLVRKWRG